MPDPKQTGKPKEEQQTALAEVTSARFVAQVEKQFVAEMGDSLTWTEYQKTLAQHMFLKTDAALKAAEAKRQDKNAQVTPYTWEHVNMTKLALDSVHRVSLGLDALIPNHIHPIAYFNKRAKKYDLDLRVGYVGKDLCRRKLAVEEPVEVRYELVFDTDEFVPHMKSMTNEVEHYEFKITKPFNRGKVVGGFGYIVYADPKKNRLCLVTQRDFDRAEAKAGSADFWGENKSRQEMQFKTVVHRVADKIPLDPRKVNSRSYAYVEAQEAEESFEREVEGEANYRLIDVETGEVTETGTDTDEPQTEGAEGSAEPAQAKPPTQGQRGGRQQQTLGVGAPGPGY